MRRLALAFSLWVSLLRFDLIADETVPHVCSETTASFKNVLMSFLLVFSFNLGLGQLFSYVHTLPREDGLASRFMDL